MTARLRSDEGGFTLIELLVAMAGAVVVLAALTTILIVTLGQTQRTFTVVNATQRASTAIADVENELHSACAGTSTPIQGGSSGSSGSTLVFLSYFGSAASPTPVWRVLSYNAGANTLTDDAYDAIESDSDSDSGSDWSQGSLISSTTLLTNVAPRTDADGNAIPVFQYYAYTAGSSNANGTYWLIPDGMTADPGTGEVVKNDPLDPDGSALSADQAENTVEVVINLSVGAGSDGLSNPELSTPDDQIDDAISLRLTTPPDQVTTTTPATTTTASVPDGYGPCE